MEKFWAVWRVDGGGPPTKRHASKSDAIKEADRLARQSSAKYYVLESVGYVEVPDIPARYTELTGKSMDFRIPPDKQYSGKGEW